jgi:hypothetical protein
MAKGNGFVERGKDGRRGHHYSDLLGPRLRAVLAITFVAATGLAFLDHQLHDQRACSHPGEPVPPMSWKILLSGYVPDYAYELGRLDRTLPFPELERVSRIKERAHAAGEDPAFSTRIREGLPVPPPP